jgi:hypothetical protein
MRGMRSENKVRVEVALGRTCLYYLKRRYGKRLGDKRVIEIACQRLAAEVAKEHLKELKGYYPPAEEGQQ